MSRRNNPGYGQSEAPHHSVNNEDGTRTDMWFKPRNAPKPERYDYSCDSEKRPGWAVYFLTVVVGIFLCAWLRPMFIVLGNAVV